MVIDPEIEERHRRSNWIGTLAMVGGIGSIAALSAGLVWGWSGVLAAALGVAALVLLSPSVPPDAVMRLYRAQRLDPRTGGRLTEALGIVAERAGLERVPQLHVIPSMTLNAFATGSREAAAIGITEGLLRRLTLREVVGVLAHEVAHVHNNDLRVMGLADVLTRFTQVMSYVGLALAVNNLIAVIMGDPTVSWLAIGVLYLAPTLSNLLQLGLSRTREYDADRQAALLTGDPAGLASALRRLEHESGQFWEDLVYPVPMRRTPQPSLLRTHPPTSDRIARLLELIDQTPTRRIVLPEGPMTTLVGRGPADMRPRHHFPGIWF